MNEPSEPHEKNVCPGQHEVKTVVDIFVPVARSFTLNYHGAQEPFEELSITLDVVEDHALSSFASLLPLRITIGSANPTDLIERCVQVLKSGFIRAKGELVTDCLDGQHLLNVHWFEAGDPPTNDGRMTGADCYIG